MQRQKNVFQTAPNLFRFMKIYGVPTWAGETLKSTTKSGLSSE
jgi:hypothetical protein